MQQAVNASFPPFPFNKIDENFEVNSKVVAGPLHIAHCRVTTEMILLSTIKTEPTLLTANPSSYSTEEDDSNISDIEIS